jgi:hypothetical protein
MNINELNAHKSTLLFYLHNSFLKQTEINTKNISLL